MAGAATHVDERATIGAVGHSMMAFEEAAELLDLEPWIVQRLRHPVEECTAYLEISRDSGEPACLTFFAVHHNEISGCSAGSLALAPGIQLRDCQAVARERAWQSALLGLPFGGASYGFVCDPVSWSERELTSLAGPLARQLKRRRVSQVLCPGRGCHREFLGRLSAALSNFHTVAITGKPDSMGGLDHAVFAAEGIAAAISAALRHAGRPSIGARVAIQGFAELGQALSQRLIGEGMEVVALSDTSGGIYRADGLILSDIKAYLAREQFLFGYTEAEHISRVDVTNVDADILALTSGTSELNKRTCGNVRAAVVIEADYNAIEEAATEALQKRNTTLVPWFVATGGTLVAAYFEAHNHQILTPLQELLACCYSTVGQAVARVLHESAEDGCAVEQAAYRLAIESAANYLRSCRL